jgi:hypothetical protein
MPGPGEGGIVGAGRQALPRRERVGGAGPVEWSTR